MHTHENVDTNGQNDKKDKGRGFVEIGGEDTYMSTTFSKG